MFRKRLKTVYELLEAGNNKKVIQEVDKLIQSSLTNPTPAIAKKKPIQQQLQQTEQPVYDEESVLVIAKALKCLALIRTNRKPEADKLIDELLDSNTTDENALSIVMQYCKETQQLHRIIPFYENAVNKCQNDPKLLGTNEHEEILSSLFNAHLRNRDFLKQQQIALKLYKQTNKMMFCFWNAASYVMMSKTETNQQITAQQKALYLQLGEKILQKAYEDQKMEYNGEFQLYLTILEDRNKIKEALEIVEAFDEEANGSKLGLTDFKVKKKMLYYKKMKQWSDLRKVCELHLANVFNANLDDWLTYLEYLDVLVELYSTTQNKDEFVEGVLAFFKLLINRIENKNELNVQSEDSKQQSTKAQGPYLAQIEFLTRLVNLPENSSTKTAYNEQFKEFFQSYIKMFASKPGFYFDISYFKKIIAKTDLSDYILTVLKQLHDEQRPFKSIKSIYTCLSYWQMHRSFGKQLNLTNDDSVKLAVEFEQLYKEALEFGKDLLPTSFQYADEFLILATHIRYDIYKKSPNLNNILQLIMNLKHGLIQSPSNYQLKLLLLNIYSHLGAYESIQTMYDSMEIKNIQNYSTANFLLVHNIRLGALASSFATSSSMDQFFTSNLFDMANFLVHCFKYGTFLKAIEIYSFMNTIAKSLTLNLCLTNSMCTSFIMHPLAQTEVVSSDETDPEFRALQTKLDSHLKEISNVSTVFDAENGLLPDDNSQLTELLLDHNDKNVLYNWEPEEEDQLATNQYKLVMDEQRRLLKLRNLMVRFTDTFLKAWLPTDTITIDLNKKFDLYKSRLVEFNYEPFILDENVHDAKLKIHVTKSNYFSRWSQLNLDKLLNCFINLSSDLCQNENFFDTEQANEQKTLINYRDLIKSLSDSTKKKLEMILAGYKADYQIEKVARIIECFSASLECLSYATLVFTACLSSQRMKSIWSEKLKKSKKKKGLYAQYAQSVDVVYEIFELLTNLINFYPNQLKQNVCPNVLSLTQALFTNQQSTIKLDNPNSSNVSLNDIAQSYSKSFDELKTNFSLKLKYLSKFAGNSSIFSQKMESLKLY